MAGAATGGSGGTQLGGAAGAGGSSAGAAGTTAAGAGGAGGTAAAVASIKASSIDGWFQLGLPLEAPGHLYVSALDASGKATLLPAGSEVTAKGGDCVYAKAFGPRVLLFAKASCDENVKIDVKTPEGATLSTTATIKTYAQPSKRLVDGWMLPDDVPPPVNLPDFADEKGLSLHVGRRGHAYVRVKFDGSATAPPYSSILSYEELTSVVVGGTALTVGGDGTFTGASLGSGTVTAELKLPKPGMIDNPYLVSATFPIDVVGDLPLTSVWIKPDNDTAGTAQFNGTMGQPCRRYHLIGRYSDGVASYYLEHAWSEATLTWASEEYGTIDAAGMFCPKAPGMSEVLVAFGGKDTKLAVEVRPEEGQKFVVRVDPNPIVVKSTQQSDCVELHVFAKLGQGAEVEITSNPAVKAFPQAKLTPMAMQPTWASCNRQTDGRLTCCSNGSGLIGPDGKTYEPSELPGVVSVYYAGSAGTAELMASP